MITTLRLPEETEALVRRIAKRTGRTKSGVIRDAIELLAERERGAGGAPSPYQRVSHLIGSVDSGGMNLSEQTGRQFARVVAQKRQGRRAG